MTPSPLALIPDAVPNAIPSPPGKLHGKVALVTGASRGLGAAIAEHLASAGAAVAVNFRSDEAAAQLVVQTIRAAGGVALPLRADVTDPAAVHTMADAVRAELGPVDILVCNAGILRDGLLAGLAHADWTAVLDTNLTGAFVPIRELLGDMIARRRGSIVCLASVHATTGGAGHCNYAAAKAGVLALTRSLALEVAPRNVRVNAVSPGLIATDMTRPVREAAGPDLLRTIPMRRFGDPLDVARAVTFLASDEASYITGTNLLVSGGLGL